MGYHIERTIVKEYKTNPKDWEKLIVIKADGEVKYWYHPIYDEQVLIETEDQVQPGTIIKVINLPDAYFSYAAYYKCNDEIRDYWTFCFTQEPQTAKHYLEVFNEQIDMLKTHPKYSYLDVIEIGGWGIVLDKSLTGDDLLNHRINAFIKKFEYLADLARENLDAIWNWN